MNKNFMLTISYDGTKYLGWQRQKINNEKTIQGKIENVLKKMTQNNIQIIGSGRTDTGVHAYKQVANFHWDTDEDAKYVLNYLNKYLPEDIAVTDVREVSDRFHSRYNVKNKTYLYRIYTHNVPPVFERKYVYYLPEILDLNKMKKAAECLQGEHDFKGFSTKSTKKSTVRNINEIKINVMEKEIDIFITANGFLYNMVRIIVGTLIEIGLGEKEPEVVKLALNEKERSIAGMTVPGKGLILYSVEY